MTIHVIEFNIIRDQLKYIAKETFGHMAKVVVDVEKGILAVGGELHVDANAELLNAAHNRKIYGALTSTRTRKAAG